MRGDYLMVKSALPTTSFDEARGEPTTHQIVASAINSGKYGFVTRRGSFALWKRGHKHDNNEQGMKLIGL